MPPPGPFHPTSVYAIGLTQVFKYFLLKHLILYVFDIFHKEMITYYFGYIFLISYPNSQEQEKRFKVLRSTVKHKIPNLSCTPYNTKLEYLHTDTHTLLYRRYGRGQFPGKHSFFSLFFLSLISQQHYEQILKVYSQRKLLVLQYQVSLKYRLQSVPS